MNLSNTNQEAKTALEWFNTLIEPYKTQAIENTRNENEWRLNDPQLYGDPKTALAYSFSWENTEHLNQGFMYWNDFAFSLIETK